MRAITIILAASLAFTFSNEILGEEPKDQATDTRNAPTSADWELKGLHLGATEGDVVAALPNTKCEVQAMDAGLTICRDWKNTLAGGSSVVIVKLLEGKVVYISIGNINLEQAQAAATALTQKYGEASKVVGQQGQVNESQREQRLYTRANYYAWKDNAITLEVVPFQWNDKKRGVTYSAVNLKDEGKHERQWIIRYNTKGKKASDI